MALGGVEWLGLPNADAYAREWLGRSDRWLGDARTLGRRLAMLPQLREAYLGGRLSTSKVELLARHLVRDDASIDEHQVIALAASMTVRQLRAELADHPHEAAAPSARRVRLTRHIPRVDALAFEGAIRLMEAIGEPICAAAIEGLLAEGLTTLLNRADLARDLVNPIAFSVSSGLDVLDFDSRADAAADDLDTTEDLTPMPIEPRSRVSRRRAPRARGSRWPIHRLPRYFENSSTRPSCTPGSRASRSMRSSPHRFSSSRTPATLSATSSRGRRSFRPHWGVCEPEPGPMSVPFELPPEDHDLGSVPLRLALPEDLATFWTRLEVLHADAGYPSCSFVAFLVAATLQTWRGRHWAPAYGDIYLRNRYRCQSPVCRSRHVTPHHIVFSSRGGDGDPTNLVSLCACCHLKLVHGGHLAVTGWPPTV